jgi:hypothetical protein
MTTLVPTSSQNQQQAGGTATATSTGVESYEDMFVRQFKFYFLLSSN